MLGELAGPGQTIWLVAFLLYLGDAARLLSPGELLLVEARRQRLAAVFSEQPFTLLGRVLAFGPVLQPHRGVFVAPWGNPAADPGTLHATLEAIAQLRRALPALRGLAVAAFLLLFVIGPLLSRLLGPSAAIVYTAAALYPTAVAAAVMLWGRRRRLRLTTGQAVRISLEILLCPAFLPNLVRKVTTALPIPVDGAAILAATATDEAREQFLTRLERRLDDVDETEHARLRAYLATLRAEQ